MPNKSDLPSLLTLDLTCKDLSRKDYFSSLFDFNFCYSKCWQHSPDARPDASVCVEIIKSLKEDDPNAGAPATITNTAFEPTQLITSTIAFDNTTTTTTTSASPNSTSGTEPSRAFEPTQTFTAPVPKPVIFDDETSDSISDSTASYGKQPKSGKTGPAKISKDGRPVCWWDKDCYRKNKDHFKEFAHPEKEEHEVSLNAYKSYLKAKMDNGTISPADRKELQIFRTTRNIGNGEHIELLKQLGWEIEGNV